MVRYQFRRAPRMESLESRELLSTVPSGQDQYMIQLLNLVRTNPHAAVSYLEQNITPSITATLNSYGVDLDATLKQIGSMSAQPPLAYNADLSQAAAAHSQDMANNGYQDHTSSTDGTTPLQRITSAGYANSTISGENIYAYATSIDQAMEAFLLDWGVSDAGHRTNIMQPGVAPQDSYRDVGIGVVNKNGPNGVGPVVVSQEFGAQAGEQAKVVGVAYNDQQGNGMYEPGEGSGNIQITAVNLATGDVSSTQTWASGGYALSLAPGKYKLIASNGQDVIASRTISISNVNVEQDFNLLNAWDGGSLQGAIASAQPNTPASMPMTTPKVDYSMSARVVSAPVVSAPVVSGPATPAASVVSPVNWNWKTTSAKKANN